MRGAWLLITTLCTLSMFAGTAAPARPGADVRQRTIIPTGTPPKILPLSEVRPGMVGEALTVFQGTKPEAFKVRVVSIMRQFLPKQDVILIRAEDPRVEFSGIVAGMSGSPVYIDGKLVGAIAYAWSFAKEPLGGVTPIETMLAERERPRRAKGELLTETGSDGIRMLTVAEGGPASALGTAGASTTTISGAVAALPPTDASSGQAHLVPVAIPLSVSGIDPRALTELAREFRPVGLIPVQAGGGRGAGNPSGTRAGTRTRETAGRVEPGSAIGVEMIRGDMSMVGTGTVTYVDRRGVLAFGHPLFGAGEIYLPLVDSEIHAILPSLAQSMKLSSPLREVGALVQDRQSCIVGDLDARVTMMPVTVSVTSPVAAPRLFRAEVARSRRLTPMLVGVVASNALLVAEPDGVDMVVSVVSRVNLKGRPTLELRDEFFSPEGVSRQGLTGTRGLRAVGELLSNPFEPVVLERLDIEIALEYRRDVTEIVGISLPGNEIRAGQSLPLRVSLRPYAGPEYIETIPIVIPRNLGGQTVRIEVSSGATAKPDMPQVESLAIYLENLRRYYPPSSIVVAVQTPGDGATLHGRVLPDLPSAAADTLRPSNQTRRADAYRVTDRTVFATKNLVFGKQELSVYVRDDGSGDARSARP